MTKASEVLGPPQLIVGIPHPQQANAMLGVLVMDRVVRGTTVGGIRARPGVTIAEVAALAREMTLKCAFWGTPAGGAKAGILVPLPPRGPDRRALFQHVGSHLGPILRDRLYWTGTDMGTTAADVAAVMDGARLPRPISGPVPEGYYSSLSVALTCQALCEWDGDSLAGKRVLIDGFGKLGGVAAQLLQAQGCRIVGISTVEGAVLAPQGLDAERLLQLRRDLGDGMVLGVGGACPREALLSAEADILVPCAGPYTLHAGSAGSVKARYVVPGANLAAREDAIEACARRGVVYCPGFVANAGETMVPHVRHTARSEAAVEDAFSRLYRRRLQALLERARSERSDLHTTALRMSLEALEQHQREEDGPRPRVGRVRTLARRLHRRIGEYL